MISGLAKAFRALGDPDMLELATNAAKFIQGNLHQSNGVLIRSCRDGVASEIRGFSDDYAFLIQGLLDLYEASADESWLKWATELQSKMDELFWDPEEGGYFTGEKSDTDVLLRLKDDHDGAEPTPTSVALSNLLRLDGMVPPNGDAVGVESEYKLKAEKILLANRVTLERIPRSVPFMVAGCAIYLKGFKEVSLFVLCHIIYLINNLNDAH
jgi:uncharacterized protein YyaL (SSP411 family)